MTNGIYESVWDALEADPEKRAELKILSSKLIDIREMISREGWDIQKTAQAFQLTPDIARALIEGSISEIDPDWISLIFEAGCLPPIEG